MGRSAAARVERSAQSNSGAVQARKALRCRRKFLRYFPRGFRDETYVDWERGYKQRAHEQWNATLARRELRGLLLAGRHAEAAARAIRLESRTNLLFSFEKMALRDAVRECDGARAFAEGLYALVYGGGSTARRFDAWCEVVGALPRKQTRVLTWPAVTVFPFLALPGEYFFFKPSVTRRAAEAYGVELPYQARPSWAAYEPVLDLAARVRRDLRDLRPRDMIDLQSFLWVLGSDEYP
jgi:hypothetical protein